MLNTFMVFSQKPGRQIEIEPFLRCDKYPTFVNAINSSATYRLAIKGISWGINSAYRIPLKNGLCFKAGVGYYRYSFTQIRSSHESFGEGDQRIIDYPTTLILGTDSYWYNTLSVNMGIEKNFTLTKDLIFTSGLTVRNYFTFSQRYHMPYDNSFIPQPELKIKNNYKTNNIRYFGLGTELNLLLLKNVGNIIIGPSVNIPIADLWKQDAIFPTESNQNNRRKWFGGLGVGIKLIYLLQKK
ncbi:MAG: hypothetical protein EAY75_13820 [Bacteroidetes bacterium]|nr:MAG: hypothetical protein EAY75_13820 [Bacteroidota bacterium]